MSYTAQKLIQQRIDVTHSTKYLNYYKRFPHFSRGISMILFSVESSLPFFFLWCFVAYFYILIRSSLFLIDIYLTINYLPVWMAAVCSCPIDYSFSSLTPSYLRCCCCCASSATIHVWSSLIFLQLSHR